MTTLTRIRLGFDVAVLALFIGAAVEALDFRDRARYMPLYGSVFAAVLATGNLVVDVLRWRRLGTAVAGDALPTAAVTEDDTDEGGTAGQALAGAAYYLGWVVGYIALIWVAGLIPATVVFLAGFLTFVARARWVLVVVGTATTVVALIAISEVMNLYWPSSLLTLF